MLAIVIPYYKNKYFNYTVESLALQTNKNFKVYIGNDASEDNPMVNIELYFDSVEFQYEYFVNNLGATDLVSQWERCINLIDSNEEWFMILGDDDYLDSNFVESFYDHLDEIMHNKSNVVRFAVQLVNDIEINKKKFVYPKLQYRNDYLFNKERSSLSEYIFSLDSYKKYGFKHFPLAWASDILAVYEFADNYPIFSINSSTVYVRISNVSISGKKDFKTRVIKNSALVDFYYYFAKSYSNSLSKDQRLILYKLIKKLFINNNGVKYRIWLFIKTYFWLFMGKFGSVNKT